MSCHFELDNGHKIDLSIGKDDKHVHVVECRTGSDPDQLIIILNQGLDQLYLFRWNVRFNKELDYQKIDKEYRIVWDKKGNPYCLMKDKTLIFE